jgi:FtsP/CotA-like multicopper oxidase with cupredoxin domain
MTASTQKFPRDTAGLQAATPTEVVELGDGDRFALRIAPVTMRIGEATVRMLAYNGSIPGPTLRVPEGAEIVVDIENEGDSEATVHWHGLRLENRYDGTHETQEVMPVGGRYMARVTFPDSTRESSRAESPRPLLLRSEPPLQRRSRRSAILRC